MTNMTGGEALVDALVVNDIDVLFGLPGVQLDPIFVALHDRRDEIRVIHARHEQGAGFMAFGYAEVTGNIGTLLVVPGPGLLNAGTAIVTGYACNSPMLCLVGQGRAALAGRGFGILHELPNQFETARGLVKWAGKITHPAYASDKIAQAVREIRSGRPRPVYLEVPFDVAAQSARVPDAVPAVTPPKVPIIDEDCIARAARSLGTAACPIIMLGGGCRAAGGAVTELAEKLNAPVILSQNALGELDCRHPLAYTQGAGLYWWDKADVVLALGTRLYPTAIKLQRGGDFKIIKVDIDPEELTRLPGPVEAIHGDVISVVSMLSAAVEKFLPAAIPDRSSDSDAVRKALAEAVKPIAPQTELLHVIRDEIGEDGVFVADVTQLYFAAPDALPVYKPRTFIHPNWQGTLGHAAATALGVKVGVPDQPVICVAGDGGFQFTCNELATAAQYNIGAIFLVVNDNAYGNVKRIMQEQYQNRVICADLQNPDFVKLAEAYGMPGRRVDSPAGLRGALAESIRGGGPALIEYQAGEFPSPWHLHLRGP